MAESIKYIGKILKKARSDKGLSQRVLSDKTKVPQNHISKIENGDVDLQTSTLLEISRNLGLELMFVPTDLVPVIQGIIRGESTESDSQSPMYTLDEQDDDDG